MTDHFCNPGIVTQTGDGFSSGADNGVDKHCRMCLWHRVFHRQAFCCYYSAAVGFPNGTSEERTCQCKR